MKEIFSNGKLLLTGEYVVLNGAKAFALPTKLGQSLKVIGIPEPLIDWKSYDSQGKIWIEHVFPISDFLNQKRKNYSSPFVDRLFSILNEAFRLSPESLKSGYSITSSLDFPSNWGLGSSSTLINNIAQWLKVDAFLLLKNTFGGSGYDIASAQIGQPLIYEIKKGGFPVDYNPIFKNDLFFVHLNRKQNSREAIFNYEKIDLMRREEAVKNISDITERILECDNLAEFQQLLEQHEEIISEVINVQTIKHQLFPDYPYLVKSLGAWGGDFILAVGSEAEKRYFKKKGYHTVLGYSEIIL
ncbi:MAG TPA: GYDIA family GHMP kinase [Salinimicrobium sp.]|nr:GYDIA family GHMP kinase [Salinimicrobium sp.]